MVRFWAWQGSMGTNFTSHERDWRPLDRVVAAAERHHQRLILGLASQGGECDDSHWKDLAWYRGGYRIAHDDDHTGLTPVAYWDWVDAIVARYKSSSAVGMWEPMNEAEASECPLNVDGPHCSGHQICQNEHAAAVALRGFFDSVGAEIKRIDPVHLVESGLLGGGQCGTQGQDFASVQAGTGIDVLSMHDYSGDAVPLPGDAVNGEPARVAQAGQLHKPLVIGELGIRASTELGCMSLQQRADDLVAKLRGDFAGGVSGVLMWNWVPQPAAGCTFDASGGDPALSVLAARA
jgi:hypothetical protein